MNVRVYFNLHNHKWSIKDKSNNVIVGHADKVTLGNVTPVVSQAGRLRVLKEKVKNVHAYLDGELMAVEGFTPFRGRTVDVMESNIKSSDKGLVVTYNPYKYENFVIAGTENRFENAVLVDMVENRKCIAWAVNGVAA